MRVVRGLAVAALVVAGGAQAQVETDEALFGREFCWGLKRLVKAAPDFVGLYKAHPAPPWLGFRPGHCRAYAGNAATGVGASYGCHQNLAPDHLARDNLAALTAACLPAAKRSDGGYGRQAVFTLPELRILIDEHGGPRAKVGRIVGFRIEAVAAPAAGE